MTPTRAQRLARRASLETDPWRGARGLLAAVAVLVGTIIAQVALYHF